MLFYNLTGVYHCLFSKAKALDSKLKKLENLSPEILESIRQRLDYYHPLSSPLLPTPDVPSRLLHSNKLAFIQKHGSRYSYDLFAILRFFDYRHLDFDFCSGDINYEVSSPAFCKSRPIGSQNNILLKLDSKRHFYFLSPKDCSIPYADKEDKLFFRGACYQANRQLFMQKFFSHPKVDAGHIGKSPNDNLKRWKTRKADLQTHLKHKFILSLEGNDVATNLKWIMSSNSLAIMPKPRFETWFMEGRLIADVHFLEIAPDFSDLEERMHHILSQPKLAEFIIKNANAYIQQFLQKETEELLGILVLRKYFYLTEQIQITDREKELFGVI